MLHIVITPPKLIVNSIATLTSTLIQKTKNEL